MRNDKSERDLVAMIEGEATQPVPNPDIPLVLGKPLYGPGGIYKDEEEAQSWERYAAMWAHCSY